MAMVRLSLVALALLLCASVAQAWTCALGFKDCDKNWPLNGCEINVHTDVNNCGDCGHKCAAFCGANTVPSCKSAKCKYTCKAPFLNCDNNWKTSCEIDGTKNVNNCGACGYKCKDMPNAITKCTSGKCKYTCKPGFSNCDGNWLNGCEAACGSDVKNCGACGVKCKDVPNAVTKCVNGKCSWTCKPRFNNCDGNWMNGCDAMCSSDVNNYGACGVKCMPKANTVTTCAGGKCVYSCKPGFANCDNNWINGCKSSTGIDANNCSACGYKCHSPNYAYGEAKCTMGKCETQSCKKGYKWESKKS